MLTLRTMTFTAGPQASDIDIDFIVNSLQQVARFFTIMAPSGMADVLYGSAGGIYDVTLNGGAGGFVLDSSGAFVSSGQVVSMDVYAQGADRTEANRVMTLAFDDLDASEFPALSQEIGTERLSFGIVADFGLAIFPVQDGTPGYYKDGQDILSLTTSDDSMGGEGGADVIDGRDGNDTLTGGGENDTLFGGAGNDELWGEEGNDSISGGDGMDAARYLTPRSNYTATRNADGSITIVDTTGEFGTDIVSGVETFYFELEMVSADALAPPLNAAPTAPAFVGAATISEAAAAGAVVGTLTASDPDEDAVTFSVAGGVFQVVGAELRRGGSGRLDFEDAASVQVVVTASDGTAQTSATLTIAVADAAERLTLGAGANDFVDRGVTEISVDGAGGNDRITGTANADDLIGGAGADSLYGGAGADSLYGGAGDDRLDGGAGADRMEGGAGDDVYLVDAAGDAAVETSASGGTDRVETAIGLTLGRWIENGVLTAAAAAGARLTGNGLDNALTGNARANALSGGDGDDTLSGGGGDDVLTGGDGDDALTGGDGVDALTGGAGADRLSGGDGADRLIGGAGADRMTGGAGADDFVFLSTRDSGPRDRDAITDFTVRIDDIDLGAIDANTGRGGDQAFRYLGDDAFSGRAGELRYDGKLVLGDVDGDRRADLVIDVTDGLALRATDFIL